MFTLAPLLERAILLAAEAHTGQVQRNGLPYILHPLAVMLQMETELEMIVAVLHDVVEDTDVTLDDLLEAGFPDEAVTAVGLLTRLPGMSYEQFIDRIRPHALARRVKLADLAHNLDVLRLPEVTARDARRLRRYRAAWEQLQTAAEEDG